MLNNRFLKRTNNSQGKDVKVMCKTKIDLISEKMGIIFSNIEDIPTDEPEEVIEYDEY